MPKKILSLSQLNAYLKGVFDDEFFLHNLTVYGEIEEGKVVGSTTYFTLKEGDNRLSCVLFSVFEPLTKGMEVEIEGGVKFYAKSGKVSFVAKSIKLRGEGAEYIKFLKLKDKLEKDGLFDKKKPYPAFVKTIAVITSGTGAVIHDFVKVLEDAQITATIKILPIKVQGENAEKEIENAIVYANQKNFCDLVVIMRGGGSEGDLSVFNGEVVALAIAQSNIHTISAVGHETNITLADLCADTRCGTPSIAAALVAERINANRFEVLEYAKILAEKLERLYTKKYARVMQASILSLQASEKKVLLAKQKAKFLQEKLVRGLDGLIQKKHNSLVSHTQKISQKLDNRLTLSERKLETVIARLDTQSPLKLLSKGFSRTEKDGKGISTLSELQKGDNISLFYFDGKADAIVTKTEKYKRTEKK
ncbi:MAG: exodeoxyribonuclease VII large subunit [Firmicutes bacterium]|nr:exodeoxyribonuclease VII large subunit [Bacillota bacterium]